MRLTSWNILHGQAISPDARLYSAISALKSDFFGLQEVDYLQERSGHENQIASVATALGTPYWAFAPSIIGSPDGQWRSLTGTDTSIVTQESALGSPAYGIGIVSKIPVRSWHRLELQAPPIGKFMKLSSKLPWKYVRDHPRCALAAVLENDWLIINTHLSFVPIFNYFQLQQVKRWTRELPIQDKKRIIIMGDFNIPVVIQVQGLNWNSLGKQLTFPSELPKVQVDFILSQKISREDVLLVPTPVTGVSDHLPLTVDLNW
ncbi:MAG TPA: endonuclease/exonuclease/phosphatase family protein [Candidatus Nanopelagicaceae bacterium]